VLLSKREKQFTHIKESDETKLLKEFSRVLCCVSVLCKYIVAITLTTGRISRVFMIHKGVHFEFTISFLPTFFTKVEVLREQKKTEE
jgi:hypothetical protein